MEDVAMKRCMFSHVLILGVTCALTGTVSAAAADAHILRVRADSWMPFNGDPASEKPGYVVELLREIYEPQGIKVDYQIMAWADALKAAAAGEIDAVIGANATEGAALVQPDQPMAEPEFAIFVRKDSTWTYKNLKSFDEIRLGAIEGYSYWPSLDGYLKTHTAPAVTFYNGDAPLKGAIQDLVDGKIAAMPESVLVFFWTVKSTGHSFSEFRRAYTEISEPLFVAFTKNSQGKQFARIWDAGIGKLKQSGRFQAILDRYGFTKN